MLQACLSSLLSTLVIHFSFNNVHSLNQVSQEPGCVEISTTGTVIDSAVNGYYVSLGTCNNKTVFIQNNSTLWQSGHNNNGVYILYFGSFNTEDSGLNDGDVMPDKGYAFYLCDTPDTYSIDGETDSNNDNSAYCAHPGNVAGCNGSPEIYCFKLVEPEYALDNNSLYTFEDYCGEDGWKQFDGSNSDSVISTFHFYENTKCTDVLSSNTIPDPSTDKPFNTGTAGDNPNQLSEELTDVWAVLGIIIGVVIVVIGFIAMLKRGKYIWELRRANKPVILPMHSKSETNTNNINTPNNSGNSSTRDNGNNSNKNNNDNNNNKGKKHKKHNRFNRFKQRGGHVTIDDIEDEEDDIDEELGAVIVSRGIHKNIHDNTINDKYHKHHVPEQPAPPIPMSSMMTHGHAAAGHAASHHAAGSMSPMASSKSRLLKSNNSNSEMLQESMIDVENDDNSNNNNNDNNNNNNNNQESENYEDRNENNNNNNQESENYEDRNENNNNNNNNRRKNSASSNRNDDSNNNNDNNTHHGNNVVSNDIIDDND